MPDAAAAKAEQKYEDHFGVPDADFVQPDLPTIVTAEYEPLVKAARNLCDAWGRGNVNEYVGAIRAALRLVVGEPK